MASSSDLPQPVATHLLSTYIASDPTLNVYRSFAALNARNILYLQTELASLEKQLLRLDAVANDKTKGINVWSLPRSWHAMRRENGEMWKTAVEARKPQSRPWPKSAADLRSSGRP